MEMTWRQAGKLTDMLVELLREGEPVQIPEMPQGQKRPLSSFAHGQAATTASAAATSLSSNTGSSTQHRTPPTPPLIWNWNQTNPTYPVVTTAPIAQPGQVPGQGYLPNFDPNLNVNLNNNGLNVNGNSLNPNLNTNGMGSGLESFFDNGMFGGLTPTLGIGMDGSNEDDMWTQLFGTFP
jgi:hypothetical protein